MENTKVTQIGMCKVELVNRIPIIDLITIMEELNNNDMRNFEPIGSGSYGSVRGYKNYAIKRLYNKNNEENHDIEVLREISHLNCIPTLYAIINDHIMISERVIGKTVRDYCNEGNDNNNEYNLDYSFIDEFENALLTVMKSGYSPKDLHEANVMIDSRTRKPMLVDVGYFVKHKHDFSNNDIHKIKSGDMGYDTANSWTGYALKQYLDRQQQKLKREADEIVEKYQKAVAIEKVEGQEMRLYF